MPLPISLVVKKGSKMWALVASSIPCPVSLTESRMYWPGVMGGRFAASASSIEHLHVCTRKLAAPGHGIARIDGQIQDHLLDLSGIGFHRSELRIGRERILDVLADQAREHLAHFGDDGVQVDHARLQHLHAAEGQQLARHGNGAAGGFLNLLHAFLVESVRAFAVLEQIAIAADDGQQIIEVVRDAARQPAHGFHFVGLAQSFFELPLLLLRAFQAGAHADKRVGDFRDFVAAARFQAGS